MCLIRRSSLPEMPRCMLPPMRTLRQGSNASWPSTRPRFSAMPTPISSFISAVYSSISCTVRLSTSVSAQRRGAPGSVTAVPYCAQLQQSHMLWSLRVYQAPSASARQLSLFRSFCTWLQTGMHAFELLHIYTDMQATERGGRMYACA